MASFDKAEWVSQGKKWEDVPKYVQQVCLDDFRIPDILAAQILPDAGKSIHEKDLDARKEAANVSRFLGILPWKGPKRGLSDSSPIYTLWRFLGKDWLSSTDEDDMLELLRERIASDPALVGSIRVEGVDFTAKITAAFKDRDRGDYGLMRWLHTLGNDIFGHGERLLTVAHLGQHTKEPHWIQIEAYEWWASKHTPDPIDFRTMPASKQTDGHSCGIFALNAAERTAFPDVPVMEQSRVVVARLQIFSKMANRILDRIADEEEESLENEWDAQSGSDAGSDEDPLIIASPPPPSFSGLAKSAQFSFCASTEHTKVLKRDKNHPDAPTPASSPAKKRVRDQSRERSPAPPLDFSLSEVPSAPDLPVADAAVASDVFGPTDGHPRETPATEKNPPAEKGGVKQAKLGSFFKVVTQEEKEAIRARELEVFRESRDARVAREEQDKYEAKMQQKKNAAERKRKSRANIREAKIAAGWEPAVAGRKRKFLELEEFDQGPSASSSKLSENSRPHRQFKEDLRTLNKPQGRKRKPENAPTDVKHTNWKNPLIWSQIETAALKAGHPWKPSEICRQAKLLAPHTFRQLTEQVVGRWIDTEAKKLHGINKWKDEVLAAIPSGAAPGGQSTRAGVLDSYPELCKKIKHQLEALREMGTPLSLVTIRATRVAFIRQDQPHLFDRVMADGSEFRCSDSFVRKFLRNTMGWSHRASTRAAQKIHPNHEEILHAAFLREAIMIRDHAIPPQLRVNSDQTQIVYQQGTNSTWNKKGEKQVATTGQEEKRAFTLVPSISASGDLLAMQAIFCGSTPASLPRPGSRGYDEAQALGFRFESSMNKKYWSTQGTMRSLVNHIIAPYLDSKKKEPNLPPTQCSLYKIDCWSVQRSDEFQTFMKTKHPTILLC
ncbi:hypothetical protein DFH09DRAFT_1330119 [Mycena vulgaris]|nr:hypothetical protein DFH09DRAFT_1330119 [Mycena vulgaris]